MYLLENEPPHHSYKGEGLCTSLDNQGPKNLGQCLSFPSLLLLLELTALEALALTSPISGSLVRLPPHSKEESQLVLQSLA